MQPTDWKAGAAAVVITPDEPMWLAGWAARRAPALTKVGELFTKALALEDASGNRVVIVTADLIAIPPELARAVAGQIEKRWHIPRSQLLFNASHTHTGPEVRPDKVPFFEIPPEHAARIEPYVQELQGRMITVINSALEKLAPATLNTRLGTASFAKNRRTPSGPVDHDAPVLEVIGSEGKPMALLFGYACHNLTLPPAFCQFHGDYAGLAQQYLEQEFPGATALFLTGAGADQDPEPRGTLELTEQHGRALADSVRETLTRPARVVNGLLHAAFEEVPLPFLPLPSTETLATDVRSDDLPRRRKAQYLLAAVAEKRAFPASHPCPVQVLALGHELLLIALGGEPVADYSVNCKARFKGPLVWVAGYSNDMFGYLPTRRVLKEGGYEGGRALLWSALPAPFTEAAEEAVMQSIQRLTDQALE